MERLDVWLFCIEILPLTESVFVYVLEIGFILIFHLPSHASRQRQDDKWEHDLFSSDKPQLSSMSFFSLWLILFTRN